MTCYLLGVGGTGAKCLEATLHVAASGLFPAERLFAAMVDADVSNGSIMRTQEVTQLYRGTQPILIGNRLFKTKLECPPENVWSPFREGDRNSSEPVFKMEEVFNKSGLMLNERASAKAMDVLFSRREQTEQLNVGFRGRPAIGAAVMAELAESNGSHFWNSLFASMQADANAGQPVSVMLVGSVFGGTGAAGVPTLGRLIRSKARQLNFAKFRLGAVVMLPYFSFGEVQGGAISADARDFVHNTKAALEYYRSRDCLQIFDAVYALGEATLEPLPKVAPAGRDQANPPHLTELCAALAVTDFVAGERKGFVLAARKDPSFVDWDDLPYADRSALRRRFLQSARFGIALHLLFAPLLEDISANGRADRAPWFIDLFSRRRISFGGQEEKLLQQVKDYTMSLLRWQASINRPAQGIETRLLALGGLFATDTGASEPELRSPESIDLTKCLEIGVNAPRAERLSLHDVWSRVCDKSGSRGGPGGVVGLLHAVYDACDI